MKPQELVATAALDEGRELKLFRHDGAWSMRVDGTELMSSRVHGSEQILAELALARVADLENARVLVGGLGMGFTLASVLHLVGTKARVDVVELVAEVIEWNRGALGEVAGRPLDDDRVEIVHGDVLPRMRAARSEYDAILLDVDNGPEGLVLAGNDRIYKATGLLAAHAALRRGGVLAIWSSGSYPWFVERLRRQRFSVEEHGARARRDKGPRRTIWLARRR
jgi:spermidine synthase